MPHFCELMEAPQPHPTCWYSDPRWLAACAASAPSTARADGLHACRIKGVPALTTPPWALYAGKMDDQHHMDSLRSELVPLIVCDFPPGMIPQFDSPWMVHHGHTRQLRADDLGTYPSLPKHRKKQAAKALASGIAISECTDVERMARLHQASRARKGIPSDDASLRRILHVVFSTTHHSSFIATNAQGYDIANAVFLHHQGHTVYAFGGQIRNALSASATVLLIQRGIQAAQALGNGVFDFGGSADPGVDQFYAEFGAEQMVKCKAVRVNKPFRLWLRWFRPDLFR